MKPTVILIRNAARQDFGGGERFPVFVASVLQSHDIRPIIVSRHAKTLAFAQQNHIQTARGWWWGQQNWSGWRTLLTPLYLLWQILLTLYYFTLFRRLKPSAVHIQSKDDFIAATIAGRLRGVTVVWTDHADLKHIWRNVSIWYKNPVGKLIYLAARHACHITLVSESEQREVSAWLPASSPLFDKLTVVYNGCTDRFDDYPERKHEATTYVIASRLVIDKGIGEAIEAFQTLHDKYTDTELIIAGDGPERSRFESLARETNAIKFLGHQSDPYKVMRRGDVFLQPTYHEGFSVALVEASMLGLPIIATSVGGNIEIIHDGTTGLLVPSKDSSALASAMERLYHDPLLAQRLGRTARNQYLEKFVFDTIVMERFVPLYEITY